MSYIEAERLGRVLIWAWNKYVKKTAIPYKEIDFHYSDWVFLLTGLVFFGIALGIILLYFVEEAEELHCCGCNRDEIC